MYRGSPIKTTGMVQTDMSKAVSASTMGRSADKESVRFAILRDTTPAFANKDMARTYNERKEANEKIAKGIANNIAGGINEGIKDANKKELFLEAVTKGIVATLDKFLDISTPAKELELAMHELNKADWLSYREGFEAKFGSRNYLGANQEHIQTQTVEFMRETLRKENCVNALGIVHPSACGIPKGPIGFTPAHDTAYQHKVDIRSPKPSSGNGIDHEYDRKANEADRADNMKRLC